jgi:phospholipase C
MKRQSAASVKLVTRGLLAAALAATITTPIAVRATQQESERSDRDRRDRDHDDERSPIRHVVVIFQENVSFDHYFATYPHAANTDGSTFTAAPGTPIANGLFAGGLLDHNPNSTQPFRLTPAQAVTCDQDHDYGHEQKAFSAGAMNKFPETVGVSGPPCNDAGKGKGLVMGYYDGNTVTALWNYAQHFAMSDNSFSTTFGPSTPGALNLIAGQTWGATMTFGSPAGEMTAIDPITHIGTIIGDPRPPLALDDCTLATRPQSMMVVGRNVGDLLNEHRVTWGWFQGGFRPTPATPAPPGGPGVCGSRHTGLSGTSLDYIPHHEPFQYYQQTANPHHLAPTSTSKIGHTDQANHQYDLQDFWSALDAGHLPAVSYLKAAAYQDGHAGYSNPLDEQVFVVETINRLMQSPEWEHLAIVVLYDDSDGWYDHVMGPTVRQSNTPDDNLFGAGNCGTAPAGTFQGRCGLGPRQPLLVVSPWARRNFVDHNVTDQASVLRFIEDNWNLGRLGNQSSDATAGSLWSLFDFNEGHPRAPQLVLNPATGKP